MTRPRRTVAALAAALCLAAPAAALAQSAGDQQYSDPLAGSTTSTSTQTQTPTTTSGSDDGGSLGQAPPSSGTGNTSTGSGTTPAPATTAQSGGQLPNTGVDARLVALIGVALLLGGAGLRLRARDGRF